MGISHGVLQSSYRLGTLTLWRDWSERLTATAESSDVADHDLAEAMRIMTDRIFTYQDFAMGLVSTSFTDHEQSLRRTGEQLRLGLVRDLIAGNDSVHPADSFMTLQYDLSINHVCGLFPGVANAVAAQVAQRVRGALPSVSTLVARLDAATVGVWFGRPKQWRPAQVAELVEQLMRCGVTVSLGDPGAGTEGFRSSYRDATRAQAVRRVWQKPPAVLRYSEVSLESMLVDDLETAEKFVAKELGELAEDTPAARRLRETLLASFSAGSHVATAEMINVHEHTVRNRLARIEEILGGTLATRRIELQVALRIKRLLDTSG
ncbi:PucR family transcriptional regulator [Prauserella muralis]|uniref:PucR family transcriptional regulator n=1 Tax=Prauserella muralis TaxID=588067 RepID=UPI0014734A43|nr:helix-turn-helix domain-containing protein [Prauserella muralis]